MRSPTTSTRAAEKSGTPARATAESARAAPRGSATFELLASLRCIGVPAIAARALPVEATRLEAAVRAYVARQPAGLRLDQLLRELDLGALAVVEQRRLQAEQLVQAEQRRRGAQRLLGPLHGLLAAVALRARIDERGEGVDRRVPTLHLLECVDALVAPADRPEGVEPGLGDEREPRRVIALDFPPGVDRRLRPLLGQRDLAAQQRRTRMTGIGARGELELLQRLAAAARRLTGESLRRELAAKMRDRARTVLAEIALQTLGDLDRLRPVAHHLRDLETMLQRLQSVARALQPLEARLGAIEQPRLEVVLAELEQRLLALPFVEVGALDEVLVDANGAVGLSPPAEQVAECEMQLDRFRIDAHDVDERVDRLVGLLVEQEVQAAEIGVGQAVALHGGGRLPGLVARREPAQAEEQRNGQQPPGFEFEHRGAASFRRPGRWPHRAAARSPRRPRPAWAAARRPHARRAAAPSSAARSRAAGGTATEPPRAGRARRRRSGRRAGRRPAAPATTAGRRGNAARRYWCSTARTRAPRRTARD